MSGYSDVVRKAQLRVIDRWQQLLDGHLAALHRLSCERGLADACLGRAVKDLVDHAVLRGRGWMIGGEASRHPYGRQVLVVETGTALRTPANLRTDRNI